MKSVNWRIKGVLTFILMALVLNAQAADFRTFKLLDGELKTSNIKTLKESLDKFESQDERSFNFGFDPVPKWFFIQFDSATVNETHILSVSYPLIDTVLLYRLKNNKLKKIGLAGDMILESETFRNNFPSFSVTPKSANDTFLIGIKTVSANQFEISLTKVEDFIGKSNTTHWFYAIFYGIIISMFFYNLFVFILLKYRPYIFYCLYLLAQMMMFSGMNGHFYEFVSQGNWLVGNIYMILGVTILSATGVAFSQVFLNIKKDSAFINRLFQLLIVINVLLAITGFFIPYQYHIKIVMAMGAISSFCVLVGGVFSYLKGNKSARFFVLSWTLYLISLVFLVLLRFGLFGTSLFLVHISEIGAVIETLLITLALIDQTNIIRKENKNYTIEIQQKAIQLNLKTKQLEEHAYHLSHILRKPIANVVGLVDILKSKGDVPTDKVLERLDVSSRELDTIIKKEAKRLDDEN